MTIRIIRFHELEEKCLHFLELKESFDEVTVSNFDLNIYEKGKSMNGSEWIKIPIPTGFYLKVSTGKFFEIGDLEKFCIMELPHSSDKIFIENASGKDYTEMALQVYGKSYSTFNQGEKLRGKL